MQSNIFLKYYDEYKGRSNEPRKEISQKISLITPRKSIVQDSSLDEFKRYCNYEMINYDPENFNVLNWWSSNSQNYPVLGKLARDHFSIQASSTPSERLFSGSGNVITDTRNRLSSETARALVCLKSWNLYFEQCNQ